jgi:hypothetical protein
VGVDQNFLRYLDKGVPEIPPIKFFAKFRNYSNPGASQTQEFDNSVQSQMLVIFVSDFTWFRNTGATPIFLQAT